MAENERPMIAAQAPYDELPAQLGPPDFRAMKNVRTKNEFDRQSGNPHCSFH